MRRSKVNLVIRFACGVGFAVAIWCILAGCQWARMKEFRQGPQVRTAQTADAVGGRYVRVGMGKWTDASGRVHCQPVYVRTDETGPKGNRGPMGDKGPTQVTVIPDRKVDLERLGDANTTYDARGGTYKRETTKVTPIWSGSPDFKELSPMESKDERLPTFSTRNMDVGETRGGKFTGGGYEGIQGVARSGTGVMFIIGSLAVLGGIVLAIWAGKVWLGLGIAAGGGGLIGTAFLLDAYPWLPLVVLLVLVGLGVWYFLDARFATKAKAALAATSTALQAVVRGVEGAPPEAQTAVKTEIAKAAASDAAKVKATISAAKTKAGV